MTSTVVLALAVFGACAVEAVEALTLVLAAGTTSWRSAFQGAASALFILAVLVVGVGIPLVREVPIDVLRVVIGALLLVLGLGWLRKAVLRASGHRARHDEDSIYARTVADLVGTPSRGSGRSAAAFTVAFKGVLLEGLEVVLVVVSLGAPSHHLALASVMAAAAAVVVTGAGVVVARQLREVPENTLKFGVGVMLTSFGLFWVGEGAGLRWPGSDAWVLVLVAGFLLLALGMVNWLTRLVPGEETSEEHQPQGARPSPAPRRSRTPVRVAGAFARFWVDFLVGDTPEIFAGTLAVVVGALVLRHERPIAIPLVLAASFVLLVGSTYRGRTRPVPATAAKVPGGSSP